MMELEFDLESREYKKAYNACRKEFPEASDEVISDCAQYSAFKKILERKLRDMD